MHFQDYILQQITDPDIRLRGGHFQHATINLFENPQRQEDIVAEGLRRGFDERRIQREMAMVISAIGSLQFRHKQSYPHFFLGDDKDQLPIGFLVDITAQCGQRNVVATLMRTGAADFLVIDSTDNDVFKKTEIVSLTGEANDYLSTIEGATFVFSSKQRNTKTAVDHIHSISIISPSPIEAAIDHGHRSEKAPAQLTLFPDAMAVLLHDFSTQLPHYADLREGETAIMPTKNVQKTQRRDDSFIDSLMQRVSSIDREWFMNNLSVYSSILDECHRQGLSVMTLDCLLNLYLTR